MTQFRLYSKLTTINRGTDTQCPIRQVDTMNQRTTPPVTAASSSPSFYQEHDFDGLRERTWYLLNRAYQNIYGLNIPSDPPYQQTIFNAAIQLMRDQRARHLNEKFLLQAFEDIIRISDEHHRQAQKHVSRASNAVYLRETALDNILEHQKYIAALEELMPHNTVRSWRMEHSGRLHYDMTAHTGAGDVIDLSVEQLAFTLDKAK